MPVYDDEHFTPPAPVAIVSITNQNPEGVE